MISLIGHHSLRDFFLQQSCPLGHAWILTGPRGVGKATFACYLAQHFLKNDPIGHPDCLLLSDPLTVDAVRQITSFINQTKEGFRIVIIDGDLKPPAAAALLKNLEDPPAKTLFFLIHQGGALLPTLRSRCQVLRFFPLSLEDFKIAGLEDFYSISEGKIGYARQLQEYGKFFHEIGDLLEKEDHFWPRVYQLINQVPPSLLQDFILQYAQKHKNAYSKIQEIFLNFQEFSLDSKHVLVLAFGVLKNEIF